MASGLLARVTAIDRAIVLVGYLHDRLRYLQPAMSPLIESACASPELAKLPYLADCRDRMRRAECFPTAWRAAVRGRPGALKAEEARVLESLADVLGATDLESQLTALDYTREQLRRCHIEAGRNREKYQKLYGTLGVLAGLAVGIILI